MSVRYIRAKGETVVQQYEHMRASPLLALGDCVLLWVNEGDFWSIENTDMEYEANERAEYERLKAKFGAS